MALFDIFKRRNNQSAALADKMSEINIIGRHYILEDITSIRSDGGIMLQPIDASSIFEYNDAEMLTIISKSSPRISKFLSRMDLSTKESAENYICSIILRTENGYGFAYGIRAAGALIGMILVDTPTKNERSLEFPHWNLDFFLVEGLENRSIMYQAVVRVLRMMKNTLNVPEVYAWVDPDNTHCLSLMAKLPFDEVQHDETGHFIYSEGGRRARLFVCYLESLKFESR